MESLPSASLTDLFPWKIRRVEAAVLRMMWVQNGSSQMQNSFFQKRFHRFVSAMK
jgi:hypothetical protein